MTGWFVYHGIIAELGKGRNEIYELLGSHLLKTDDVRGLRADDIDAQLPAVIPVIWAILCAKTANIAGKNFHKDVALM